MYDDHENRVVSDNIKPWLSLFRQETIRGGLSLSMHEVPTKWWSSVPTLLQQTNKNYL
jgi:hypothetical protein